MEIGVGPIAGFGGAPAERLSRYWVACPHWGSFRFFYGPGLRHLRFDYCDSGKPFACRRRLRWGPLLRDFVNPALVLSENFGLGTWGAGSGDFECI